jgi:hypothetical protein
MYKLNLPPNHSFRSGALVVPDLRYMYSDAYEGSTVSRNHLEEYSEALATI